MNGAGARRAKFGVRAAITAVAVTAACVFAGVIASKVNNVFDVTATREHMLSPRTQRTLESLDKPYELLVVVNSGAIDAPAAQRTKDVLDSFDRASSNLSVTVIDVASAQGSAELDRVLVRLRERFAKEFDAYTGVLGACGTEIERVREGAGGLSGALEQAGAGVPLATANAGTFKKFCTDSAAICRLVAQDLGKAEEQCVADASSQIGKSAIPAVDEASKQLRASLHSAAGQLKGVSDGLDVIVAAEPGKVPEDLRLAARGIAGEVRAHRDALSRLMASIDDLPRLVVASVARVLERSSAAVVIGPPGAARGGVTGIDVGAVFPPTGSQNVRHDLRAKTEDLLTSAVTALASTDAPIVVLVHGTGVKLGPEFPMIKGLAERLSLRGMDVLEWAVAVDPEPPALTKIDPANTRPAVYVTLPAQADSPETAQRMLKLANAMKKLAGDGRSMLVSVNPSGMPAIGQPDPLTDWLSAFGVKADTGRPLLKQLPTPSGREVLSDIVFTDPGAEHAISTAIRGLATDLLWAVPLELSPGSSVQAIAVLKDEGGSVWAESEWSEFRRVAPDQRGLISNPPGPDSSRDATKGPWTIAAAVERANPTGSSGAQRLVVVGSNGWFFDELSQSISPADGRSLLLPGNGELFEASVYWLAGQNDRVSTSARASAAALLPSVPEAKLSAIRWGLSAGLPVLILLLGVLWRIWRG